MWTVIFCWINRTNHVPQPPLFNLDPSDMKRADFQRAVTEQSIKWSQNDELISMFADENFSIERLQTLDLEPRAMICSLKPRKEKNYGCHVQSALWPYRKGWCASANPLMNVSILLLSDAKFRNQRSRGFKSKPMAWEVLCKNTSWRKSWIH